MRMNLKDQIIKSHVPKIHSGGINDQGAVHARTSGTVRDIHIPLPLLHRDSYTEIFEFSGKV